MSDRDRFTVRGPVNVRHFDVQPFADHSERLLPHHRLPNRGLGEMPNWRTHPNEWPIIRLMASRMMYRWLGKSGRFYTYQIYELPHNFKALPGNYIFAKEAGPTRMGPSVQWVAS